MNRLPTSLRSPRIRLLGTAIALALLATAPACTHPCLALAEELCECRETELEREQCLTAQRNSYGVADEAELDAQKSACTELLDVCDCRVIETQEGKEACGLAR